MRWHAGYEKSIPKSFPSLSDCTWPPNGLQDYLDHAVGDIVETLSAINLEMNGAVPSETVIADANISRFLVSAISEIQGMLRVFRESCTTSEAQESVRRYEFIVEIAWAAVLDGDIDDLREHIAAELAAR
jgi:hypothetical protein